MKETEKVCINPFEDQRRGALEHYLEVSSKAHHWSSFVERAIREYTPDLSLLEFAKWLDNDRNNHGPHWKDLKIWGKENACQTMLSLFIEQKNKA